MATTILNYINSNYLSLKLLWHLLFIFLEIITNFLGSLSFVFKSSTVKYQLIWNFIQVKKKNWAYQFSKVLLYYKDILMKISSQYYILSSASLKVVHPIFQLFFLRKWDFILYVLKISESQISKTPQGNIWQ